MIDSIKLTKNKNGTFTPCMTDGTPIPAVVKGSVKIICDDDKLQGAGYVKVRLDYFVKTEDVIEAIKPLSI